MGENLFKITRNFVVGHYLSGFFLFVLGWQVGLPKAIVYGVPCLFYFAAFFASRRELGTLSRKTIAASFQSLPRLACIILSAFFILNFLFSLLPPSEHVEADSLLYNLTIPWQYYLRGGVVPLDWSMNDKFPFYLQMAQLPFTVLAFPWVVKVWMIFFPPALLVVTWAWGSLLGFKQEDKAWIIALTASLALFVKQYGMALFDIPNTVYILSAFYYLVRAIKSQAHSDLIWGALFLGMACAAKTFLVFLLFAWWMALIIWKIISAKKFNKFDGLLVFLPGLFASIFMAPFLIRNWITIGNPVFPLLQNYFGPLIENELHHQVLHHAQYGYGYGRSLLDFFLMPLRMVFTSPRAVMGFDYWTDPILLVFLAAAFAGLRRQYKEPFGLVFLIAFFLYLFLFLGSQQARYFYPFWILIVWLGGALVFKWFGKKLWRWILTGQMIGALAFFCFFHRDALRNLKYIPQGKYLENASFSFVWNKNLEGSGKGTVKQLCLRKAPGDSIVDLFYFTVPIKILGHTTSIAPFDPRFANDCDRFMIGTQWPPERIYRPEGRGLLVSKERFFSERF